MELEIRKESCLPFLQVATKADGKNPLESLLMRLSKLQEVTLSIDPHATPLSSIEYPEKHEDFRSLRSKFSQAYPNLGLYHYLSCTDLEHEPKIFTGDAIDDLLDIYCEVKTAMSIWEKEPMAAACDLKLSYWRHWGSHVNDLQKVVFERLHD